MHAYACLCSAVHSTAINTINTPFRLPQTAANPPLVPPRRCPTKLSTSMDPRWRTRCGDVGIRFALRAQADAFET